VLLNPKKAKILIPDVASATGYSEDLIEAVTSFYWQEVRKSLSSLKHQRIHITNLGDFVIKHWKIDQKITNLEKWEESNKQKGLQQMTARFKTAENLFDLKSLERLMEEELQRKDFIKLHKNKTNEPKRKHNKNMEEQGSDC
jgi:nucleoid DNA-binding protein